MPTIVVNTFYPSTWKADAGRSLWPTKLHCEASSGERDKKKGVGEGEGRRERQRNSLTLSVIRPILYMPIPCH